MTAAKAKMYRFVLPHFLPPTLRVLTVDVFRVSPPGFKLVMSDWSTQSPAPSTCTCARKRRSDDISVVYNSTGPSKNMAPCCAWVYISYCGRDARWAIAGWGKPYTHHPMFFFVWLLPLWPYVLVFCMPLACSYTRGLAWNPWAAAKQPYLGFSYFGTQR